MQIRRTEKVAQSVGRSPQNRSVSAGETNPKGSTKYDGWMIRKGINKGPTSLRWTPNKKTTKEGRTVLSPERTHSLNGVPRFEDAGAGWQASKVEIWQCPGGRKEIYPVLRMYKGLGLGGVFCRENLENTSSDRASLLVLDGFFQHCCHGRI